MISFELKNPNNQAVMNGQFSTGERIALLGESGAGKTTFLRCLAGLTNLLTGSVSFNNSDKINPTVWQRPVSLVHQHPVMFSHHTVEQTLKFSQQYARQEYNLPLDEWLARLELTDLVSQPTQSLSGGQQQRVALLRALVNQPQFLLLDESFSGLDPLRIQRACDVVNEYCKKTGAGLIIASHNNEPQRFLCNTAYHVDNFNGTYHSDLFAVLKSDVLTAECSTINVDVHGMKHGFLETYASDQSIYTPIPERWYAGIARLSIDADMVSITIGEHHQTSMVNRLICTIDRCEYVTEGKVNVQLNFADQKITASITQWSFERLNLKSGMTVNADFKLSAARWAGQTAL